MKTLAESLFDKDIIEKDLTFGDVWEFEGINFSGWNDGYYAYDKFKAGKLKKDYSNVKREAEAKNKSSLVMNDDKQSQNRWVLSDIFLHIIKSFDMSKANDNPKIVKRRYQYHTRDVSINNLMTNMSIYIEQALEKYVIGDKPPYIHMYYDDRKDILYISIGKPQTMGPAQVGIFEFKRK